MRPVWTGKRQSERRVCQTKGQIRLTRDAPGVDCIICDLSLTGARITAPEGIDLPPYFDLFIPTRQETKFAVVRWNREGELGLEFMKSRPEENPIINDLAAKLAALEAVVAETRKESQRAETTARDAAQKLTALEAKNAELLKNLQSLVELMAARSP